MLQKVTLGNANIKKECRKYSITAKFGPIDVLLILRHCCVLQKMTLGNVNIEKESRKNSIIA